MNTLQLQNQLIVQIKNTQDVALLQRLKQFLDKTYTSGKVYKTSDLERNRIDQALANKDAGTTFNNEDIFSELDEWLKE